MPSKEAPIIPTSPTIDRITDRLRLAFPDRPNVVAACDNATTMALILPAPIVASAMNISDWVFRGLDMGLLTAQETTRMIDILTSEY